MDEPQTIYPKPDWLMFGRTTCVVALILAFFHWIPDLAIWTYAKFGVTLVVSENRMEFILYVAYLMAGLGFVINLAGLLWASWHYPQRIAYERERSNRLAQSIDVEIAERLDAARQADKMPSQ